MENRRNFLKAAFTFGAGAFTSQALAVQNSDMQHSDHSMNMANRNGQARVSQPVPVDSPDIPQLQWRMDGNMKEFHLIAEPVKQELLPGRVVDLWGFNGSAPGPT